MQLIGLTGGIASGKSTSSEYLQSKGIPVIDSDQLSHEVLQVGTWAYRRVAELFPQVLNSRSGEVDRNRLGEIVFANPKARKQLEAIVHPAVVMSMVSAIFYYWIRGYKRIVLDIPLLFETGIHRIVSYSILVRTSERVQKERLTRRSGLTKRQIKERLGAQLPLAEKQALAKIIVDNNGTKEELYRQLDVKILRKRPSIIYHSFALFLLPLFFALFVPYLIIRRLFFI